jgi:hypothetical protein
MPGVVMVEFVRCRMSLVVSIHGESMYLWLVVSHIGLVIFPVAIMYDSSWFLIVVTVSACARM